MKVAPLISRDENKSQLDARRAFLLIDVLPAEFYEEARLPGAKDACVYEVNFLDQVRNLARGSFTRNWANISFTMK